MPKISDNNGRTWRELPSQDLAAYKCSMAYIAKLSYAHKVLVQENDMRYSVDCGKCSDWHMRYGSGETVEVAQYLGYDSIETDALQSSASQEKP